MKVKELKALPIGTLVYNGHTEGIITEDCGEKGISIFISIAGMSNDSSNFDERPEYWEPLDD